MKTPRKLNTATK